jgi:DNA-binding CsgD family transcriptional regulator
MKSTHRSVLQFITSEDIGKRYPTFRMRKHENEFLSTLSFVEKLMPERAIVVCQRSETPAVEYASENCARVFGYDANTIAQMPLSGFLALIHPDDIQPVHQCVAFINALEPYNPLHYRFEMHYRLKHKSGAYVYLIDEKMSIQYSDGTYIYIDSFRDVTHEEKFHDVRLNIYQCFQGAFRKTNTYIPRQNAGAFTPRQKDIVNLINKGFTNQEIARQLNVSLSTVKNHKSLLFKKTNVKSSVALAMVTREL